MFTGISAITGYIIFQIISSFRENKNLAKKLTEEYNHKYSLVSSVLGFGKTYKENEGNKEIIEKMILALERNPSDEINCILQKSGYSIYDKVVDSCKDTLGNGAKTISNLTAKKDK